MSYIPTLPVITLFLGLGFILLILCGITTWTTWVSFRVNKMVTPKLKFLFTIAFLQILLGVMTVWIVKAIQDEPFIAIGTGLIIMLLSGLFFIKWILKNPWKLSLRVWAMAALMQVVLVPVCSVFMSVIGVWFLWRLFPPQL